jgi:hypothetical protein
MVGGVAPPLDPGAECKPGIVVTAAHCVANYGQSQFYSGWTFVPAYNNGSAPYGTWIAATATVPSKILQWHRQLRPIRRHLPG